MKLEENPFDEAIIAQEWIAAVENEKGTIRDKEINPLLFSWVNEKHPDVILDLGCGQGYCSEIIKNETIKYIGIDSSEALIERAKQKYGHGQREFVIGDVYNLPLKNDSIDACFSITVWFHLGHLEVASKELSRVLKPGGNFLIITADPDAYDLWETHYTEVQRGKHEIIGRARILLNPDESIQKYAEISKNNFYFHTLDEIVNNLEAASLKIEKIEKLGLLPIHPDRNLFIAIFGTKS